MTLEVGIHLMGGRETKLSPSLTPSLLDIIRPLEVLIGNNSGAVTSLRSKVNALFAALECVHMQTELGVWLPCIVMHQSQGRYRRFFLCSVLPSSLLSSQLARAHSWGRLDQPGRESIQERVQEPTSVKVVVREALGGPWADQFIKVNIK